MTGAIAERAVRLRDGNTATLTQWGERGPLVVGIHGVASSRLGWARIGGRLRTAFRVVGYDQRGHGESAAVGGMTFAQSVRDCVDVVRALGEPVRAILGHSWGGAVAIAAGRALAAGAEGEGLVERGFRVVAIDPMLRAQRGVWSRSVLPEYRRQLAQPLDERERELRAAAGLPAVEVEAKLYAARRTRLEPIEALGRENGIDDGRWDFLDLLDAYPCPLWIAVAGLSRSVFLEQERVYAAAHGGANVRVTVYEGASHSLQRDAFEWFAPDLEAFLTA